MEEEKGPRKKKKRGRTVLIVLGVLVVVGLILHWPTESGFTISRETTYVTGPLNPDGTINYVAALNEMMSKGVTPENNAAPLLITAVGPASLDDSVRDKQLELLGIEHLPLEGDYFVKLDDYLAEADPQSSAAAALEDMDSDERQDMLDTLCETPWSAADHPAIAAWLKANQKPLAMVAQATKRPRYYLPLVSGSSIPRLVETMTQLLPYFEQVEALKARAMLKLDGGDVDGAMADLLAGHRLARLLVQAPMFVDKIIALAVEAWTAEGTIALANSGRLAGGQARRILLELNTLGAMPEIVDAIDHGERFFTLDCVMILCSGESLEGIDSGPLTSRKYYGTAIDWDRMLRNFNRWYDRIVDAVREPDRRKRQNAVNGLKYELSRMRPENPTAIIKLILGRLGGRASRAVMTDALSNVLISILIPVFGSLPETRYRAVVRYDLARVALALVAFKAEKGEYPEKLSELSPAYIKKIPADIFAEGPLVYKRDGKGYLLYSLGPNMIDDGGLENEDGDEDDIAVRVK